MSHKLVNVYQCPCCEILHRDRQDTLDCCQCIEAWEIEAYECEETGYLYLSEDGGRT